MKTTPHRFYFALEAWSIGVLTAVLVWTAINVHRPWNSADLVDALLLAMPIMVLTALSALGVSTRRAGALEVGAVLSLAFAPLALAQLASWWMPGDYIPNVYRCACEHRARSQHALDGLFAFAEAGALAGLAAGAVGLAARRPSALRLGALVVGVLLGGFVGARAADAWGAAVGAGGGLTAVVFLFTARSARSERARLRTISLGARGLAVLALALSCSMAVRAHMSGVMSDLLFLEWLDHSAATFVLAHRALLIGLGGCAALLGFALWTSWPVSVSPSDARVVMVGLLLCVGAAAHLRSIQIDAFNTTWAHFEPGRVDHAFAAPGPAPETGPLPWPIRGELTPLPRLGARSVRLVLPDPTDCPTMEIRAGDRQLDPEDGATYGDVLRGLEEERW